MNARSAGAVLVRSVRLVASFFLVLTAGERVAWALGASITSHAVAPDPFTPNDNLVDDTTRVTNSTNVTVTQAEYNNSTSITYAWVLTIRTNTAPYPSVRQYVTTDSTIRSFGPGTHAVIKTKDWDGKNASGVTQPVGMYKADTTVTVTLFQGANLLNTVVSSTTTTFSLQDYACIVDQTQSLSSSGGTLSAGSTSEYEHHLLTVPAGHAGSYRIRLPEGVSGCPNVVEFSATPAVSAASGMTVRLDTRPKDYTGAFDDLRVCTTVNGQWAQVAAHASNTRDTTLGTVTAPITSLSATTFKATYDETAPVVSLVPASGVYAAASVNIDATFEPFQASQSLTVDGTSYGSGPVTVTTEGTHSFSATSTDHAGHVTTVSGSLDLDRTSPVIGTTTPASGSIVGATSTSVSVHVTDAHAVASVSIGGQAASNAGGGNWTLSSLSLPDEGSNAFDIVATDEVGNTSSPSVLTLVRDTEAPDVSIVSHTNGQLVNSTSIQVAVSVYDPNTVASVTINGDLATYHAASNTWRRTMTLASEGANTISVASTDGSGNVTNPAATFSVVRDTTLPTVSVNSPANASTIGVASTLVRVSAGDSNGVASVTIGGLAMGFDHATGLWQRVVALPAEGPNDYAITAQDRAGNTFSAPSLTLIRDTMPISISVVSPVDESVVGAGTVLVSVSASDSHGIASVAIAGSEATFDPGSATWRRTVALPTEGPNVVEVSATNTIGQTSDSASVTLVRDLTPPELSVPGTPSGEVVGSATVVLGATATDRHGVASVTMGGVAATFDSTTSRWVATVSLDEGANEIVVTATDTVGNESDPVSVVVVRDASAPVVAFTSPSSGVMLATLQADVSGTVSDASRVTSVLVNSLPAVIDHATGTWRLSVPLDQEGTNVLSAVAEDSLGNTSVAITRSITRDTVPPAVTVDAPLADGQVIGSDVDVTGHAVDEHLAEVTVNDEEAEQSGSQFAKSMMLACGANAVRVKATDEAGNTSIADVQVMARSATGGITTYFNDRERFDTENGSPPIIVTFDSIEADTALIGGPVGNNHLHGATFNPGPGGVTAQPIVVAAAQTYTPPSFSGVSHPELYQLVATSCKNVLSPGGRELGPGLDPLIERDDLEVVFDSPVQAVGFDVLFQSADCCTYTTITLHDEWNNILSTHGVPPSPGASGSPGSTFCGFAADNAIIKRIVVAETDDNAGLPDANIGFDTFRFAHPTHEPCGIVDADGETTLTYAGSVTGEWNDAVRVAAYLRDASIAPPAAVPHARLLFQLGAQSCTAVTDDDGLAECEITPDLNQGSYDLSVTYDGGHGDCAWWEPTPGQPLAHRFRLLPPASIVQSFAVLRETSTLHILSASIQPVGAVEAVAAFREEGAAPISNHGSVAFSTATWGAPAGVAGEGLASTGADDLAPGSYTLTAATTQDDRYEAATTSHELVVLPLQISVEPVGDSSILLPAVHQVVARVLNTGSPLAGHQLRFAVSAGPHAGVSGTYGGSDGISDSDGIALWSFNGEQEGVDAILAYVDSNDNGAHDAGEVHATTTVRWYARHATALTYVGDVSARYNDATRLAARLDDISEASATPVQDARLTLTLGSESCTASTGPDGIAACSVTPTQPAGDYALGATFGGDSRHFESTLSGNFPIQRSETTLFITSSPTLAVGSVVVEATLREDGAVPIEGRQVHFSAGTESGTATTNEDGIASTTLNLPPGEYLLTASFSGDGYYEPSAAPSQALYVYGMGSFVIWGGNEATVAESIVVGSDYQFWGSQWARQVTAGDYDANPSFKGYASNTDHPGGVWWSAPGNSSDPPATIPDYMGVIVSTQITKDGSTEDGDIAATVVLRVLNPQHYQPNPGHQMWGTVVSYIVGDGPSPEALPGAPTNVVATAGNGSAVVTWSAPSHVGDQPVTGYTVTSIPTTHASAQPVGSGLSRVVTGLTNGVSYTFQVTATNPLGTGASSDPSASVTPATTPDAPVIDDLSLVEGPGSLHVEWSTPANGGSSPLTYTVRSIPPGGEVTTTSTSADVTGLLNGRPYQLVVTAANAVGTGPESAPSAWRRPYTSPGAPTAIVASAGNGEADVYWTRPASDGGRPISHYRVTASPGGAVVTTDGVTLSAHFSGLSNGIPVAFSAVAETLPGLFGDPTDPVSPLVTPAGAPGEPTGSVTEDNGDVTVHVVAPVDNGGAAVTGFVITQRAPGTAVRAASATESSVTFTGLANGTPYEFDVSATNAVGASDPVPVSGTPGTVPDAPSCTGVVDGDRQVTVSWAPLTGDQDGGRPITGYVVTACPGGEPVPVEEDVFEATIGGLENGTSYVFEIHATNEFGRGPSSEQSARATPATIPECPPYVQAQVAGVGQALVSWLRPSWDGGAAIESYTVSAGATTWPSVPGDTTSRLVTGLTPGTEYEFHVIATNRKGSSVDCGSSVGVVAAECPGVPTNLMTSAGDGALGACWSPPVLDGFAEITGYQLRAVPRPQAGLPTPATIDTVVPPNRHCITVAGVENGFIYDVSVRAINDACSSAAWLDGGVATPHVLSVVLDLDTESVIGGDNDPGVWATVTLDGLAGPEGYPLAISSGSTAAWCPTQLTISPGTDSIMFRVITAAVNITEDDVEITASSAGSMSPSSGSDTFDIVASSACATPTARFYAPVDGVEVWDHEQDDNSVVITAECATDYEVQYKLDPSSHPDSELEWAPLPGCSGTGEIDSPTEVCRIDPTMMLNGIYELRIVLNGGTVVATDEFGSPNVILRGNQKLGHFSLAYTDLTVPIAGIPFQIVRTYDSRDMRRGDFGVGWQLAIRDVRVEVTHPPALWWSVDESTGAAGWPSICVVPGIPHSVMISLSGGQSYRFEPEFARTRNQEGSNCGISEPNVGWIHYRCASRPRAKLTPYSGGVVRTDVYWGDYDLYYGHSVPDIGTDPLFDPDAFDLELPNGTVYHIVRDGDGMTTPYTWQLESIRDTRGNRIDITHDGIVASPSGREVRFLTGGAPRQPGEFIDHISAPQDHPVTLDDPLLAYYRDGSDRLVRFQDREMRFACNLATNTGHDRETGVFDPDCEPKFVQYDYDDPTYPYYLTNIHDPDDAARIVVRNVYDSVTGRLEMRCRSQFEDPANCVTIHEPAFGSSDNTQAITDRKGYITTLHFDGHGNVTRRDLPPLEGSTGIASELFEYDAFDRVTKEITPDGNGSVGYTYVGDDVHSITPLDASGNPIAGLATVFEYSNLGALRQTTLPGGQTTSSVYDQYSGFKYSDTDALGNVTTYAPTDENLTASATDPLSRTTSYVYMNGLLRTVTDPTGAEIRNMYSPAGNLVSVTRPDRSDGTMRYVATSYTLDRNGTIIRTTTASVSESGEVIQQLDSRASSFDLSGRLQASTDARGNVTTHVYDAYDQLSEVQYADGTLEQLDYDLNGNTIYVRARDGSITHHNYNSRDLLWKTWWGGTNSQEEEPPAGVPYEENVYDDAGRLVVKRTTRLGADGTTRLTHGTCYEFDEQGRQFKVKYPDPLEPDDCPAGQPFTEVAFDSNGWEKWRRDATTSEWANNWYTVFRRDAVGRVTTECRVQRTTPPPDDLDLDDEQCKRSEFDDAGQLVREWDDLGRLTSFGFDDAGRLETVTDPLSHTWSYSHDDHGNLIAQVDPMLRQTRYHFDLAGNRDRRWLPLDSYPSGGETFTFDRGFMTSHVDFNGNETTWTPYEESGQVHEIEYPSTGPNAPATTVTFEYANPTDDPLTPAVVSGARARVIVEQDMAAPQVTAYAYDGPQRRLASVVYPNDASIAYEHDDDGGVRTRTTHWPGVPVDRTTTMVLDSLGRVASTKVSSHPTDVTTTTHDASGRVETITYPDGLVAHYSDFDAWGRVQHVDWTSGATTVASNEYEYGECGNVEPAHRLIRRTDSDDRVTEFCHDAADRLISEEVRVTSTGALVQWITYTYDSVGNRLSRVVVGEGAETVSYGHDANDRLIWTDSTVDGYTSLSWDDNGNLVERDAPGVADDANYEWDAQNRLVRVVPGEGDPIRFAYDVDGIRQSMTVEMLGDDETTSWLVDPQQQHAQVLEEHGPGGAVTRWVLGSRRLAQLGGDDTVRWLVTDSLGTVRGLLPRGSSALSTSHRYEAFGTPLDHEDEAGFRFTGEPWQPELGMVYLRARWMVPDVGAFTSTDPLRGKLRAPKSLNVYTYGNNNPLVETDRTGGASALETLVTAGLIGALTLPAIGCAQQANQTVAYTSEQQLLLAHPEFKPKPGETPACHKAFINAILTKYPSEMYKLNEWVELDKVRWACSCKEPPMGFVGYDHRARLGNGDPEKLWHGDEANPSHPGYIDTRDPYDVTVNDTHQYSNPYQDDARYPGVGKWTPGQEAQ